MAHLNSYLKEFHPSEQSAPLFYSMRDGKPHRLSTDSISLVVGTAAKMARETCNAVPEIGGTEKLWKNKNAKQALYTLD